MAATAALCISGSMCVRQSSINSCQMSVELKGNNIYTIKEKYSLADNKSSSLTLCVTFF